MKFFSSLETQENEESSTINSFGYECFQLMCCFSVIDASVILELHLLFRNNPPKKTSLALNCFETSCCSKRVLSFHLNYPLESCNSTNYFSCNEAAVGLVVIVSKIIQHCCKVSSNPACSIWNTNFLSKLPFSVVV